MLPIRIGAEVQGPEGKLGEVSKLVVDPALDTVTHLAVKRGMFGGTERLVGVNYFADLGDGKLWLGVTGDEFEQFSTFDSANYRSPDPDYRGDAFDAEAAGIDSFQMDAYVAFGPLNGLAPAAPSINFRDGGPNPDRETETPRGIDVPSIDAGSDVYDAEGEKVGEVAEIDIDEMGHPRRLVVRRGFLFRSETEIPADLIDHLGHEGVRLKERRSTLERRAS